ncbi:hypothetical protein [Aeromicrobium sp. 179-A 4D2 NHS]|uniref:hypothetical protein n=1 Tax=Aeromicrobium sp. 179-A 4D2 NHS TaxID=3142375 RepID=UPI00399FF391
MIRTTRGARQLVAALVAVLLAGVVGLVAAASFTRSDAERTTSSLTDPDGTSGQHRATVVSAQDDDHHVVVDLPATTLAPGLSLLAAVVTAIAAARLASGHGTLATIANGRAPPARLL